MVAAGPLAHHGPMPTAAAHPPRLLLFADTAAGAPTSISKVRRFRLARLPREIARRGEEPRYAYLKRSYD